MDGKHGEMAYELFITILVCISCASYERCCDQEPFFSPQSPLKYMNYYVTSSKPCLPDLCIHILSSVVALLCHYSSDGFSDTYPCQQP